ncbi:MAG: hypothetical protein IPL84_10510 [Chitinophagaceae bacterium]|nr:hypothetical protein [Chitinophagaceae bacterium]
MKYHNDDKFFCWGLKNGEIVHVDNVENGLACKCVCPDCETPLIAFNRKENKRKSHFQHQNEGNCTNAYETALHYLAKQIILKSKRLTVPVLIYRQASHAFFYDNFIKNFKKVIPETLTFDRVEIEKNEGEIRPDLKCFVGDYFIQIEIAVTHFVDGFKKEKIINQGIPLLEIDLSKFARDIHISKLEEILQGKIDCMKWIHNPINERSLEIIEVKYPQIQKFVQTNLTPHKYYSSDTKIRDCPIVNTSYTNVFVERDCKLCRYFVKEYPDQRSYEGPEPIIKAVICIGHRNIAFDNLLKMSGIGIEK